MKNAAAVIDSHPVKKMTFNDFLFVAGNFLCTWGKRLAIFVFLAYICIFIQKYFFPNTLWIKSIESVFSYIFIGSVIVLYFMAFSMALVNALLIHRKE